MNTQKLRRGSGLIAIAGLAVALVGCSGGQSTADACKIANDNMTEVTQEAQASSQAVMEAMASGEDVDFESLFAPTREALAKTQEEVTNEEVAAAVDKFATAYESLTDELSTMEIPDMSSFDPSDPEAMAQAEEIQAQATELQETMTTQAENLTASMTELTEVCGA